MNTSSAISEPTRYNESGQEVPDGTLVFYSDWLEMKQRAEQASSRAYEAAARVCDDRRNGTPMMCATVIRQLAEKERT